MHSNLLYLENYAKDDLPTYEKITRRSHNDKILRKQFPKKYENSNVVELKGKKQDGQEG